MVPTEIRMRYAQNIRDVAQIRSTRLVEAFARVPREQFLGPAPWRMVSGPSTGVVRPEVTEVLDSSEVYRDVAVFLDPTRNLTNGNPSTLARWIDALDLSPGESVFHLGCGSGYYTAILAEVVGPNGKITAVEVDSLLSAQSRANLAAYTNVEIVEANGAQVDIGQRDAIFINAGVSHPLPEWLQSLKPGGRLIAPITVEFGMPHIGKGFVLYISRVKDGYAARFLPVPVMIYSCSGLRNDLTAALFGEQFMAGTIGQVRSVRPEPHEEAPECWLHTSSLCLSTRFIPAKLMNHSIVTDPTTFPTAFDHALNAGDLDQILRLYDPEASIRTSEGFVGQGVNQISQEMRKLISANAQITNRLRHILQTGETALIVVDWTLELNTPDGRRVTAQGTATNVIRQTAEHGWRMMISNPQGTA